MMENIVCYIVILKADIDVTGLNSCQDCTCSKEVLLFSVIFSFSCCFLSQGVSQYPSSGQLCAETQEEQCT